MLTAIVAQRRTDAATLQQRSVSAVRCCQPRRPRREGQRRVESRVGRSAVDACPSAVDRSCGCVSPTNGRRRSVAAAAAKAVAGRASIRQHGPTSGNPLLRTVVRGGGRVDAPSATSRRPADGHSVRLRWTAAGGARTSDSVGPGVRI
jgi:hypothetical protein